MTTGQSQKNITYKGCTIDDGGSLDPVRNKVDMLEADDSERACIPSKLQLANFCQLRKAEIGLKQAFKLPNPTSRPRRDCIGLRQFTAPLRGSQ